MWIRIDRMRIRFHKIWWMGIRIQYNKISKSFSYHLLKVKKNNIFKSVHKGKPQIILRLPLEISYFFRFRFPTKKIMVNLCFSLHFIPLDPHSEYGSGSTNPNECRSAGPGSTSLYISNIFVHICLFLFRRWRTPWSRTGGEAPAHPANVVVYHVTIVAIGHGLLKKFSPMVIGCVLRTAGSSIIWNYADPLTSLELLNCHLILAMTSK